MPSCWLLVGGGDPEDSGAAESQRAGLPGPGPGPAGLSGPAGLPGPGLGGVFGGVDGGSGGGGGS